MIGCWTRLERALGFSMGCPQISNSEISVVVQGPIVGSASGPKKTRHTARVLESIRKVLPGAHIILSTWEGSDLTGLDYDEAVLSADPGGLRYGLQRNPSLLNNVNRQLVSTIAGLRAVRTRYAVKTRSDLLFTSADFLRSFDQYNDFDPEWQVVEKRVVSCNFYARNPRVHFPFLYHPGDFFNFGLTSDLLAIWDIKLQPKSYSRWFLFVEKDPLSFDDGSDIRYYPEQYIWLKFLEKHGKQVSFDHASDFSERELERSERSLVNNLVFQTPEQCGVRWLKQNLTWWERSTLYTQKEWLAMYHRYVLRSELSQRDLLAWARPVLQKWEERRSLAEILAVQAKHARNHIMVLFDRIFVRAPRKLKRMLSPRQMSHRA